jgi:hypothetical protein
LDSRTFTLKDASKPAAATWLLGFTQIIGYGSLYYSISILADDIAATYGWTEAGFFGVFSLALLAGAVAAPFVGRAVDRFGAARMMSMGSVLSALTLAVTAWAPGAVTFTLAFMVMQVVACFVMYDAAFPALVQLAPADGRRRIIHLTLIAGFASSLFWPLTSWIDQLAGWRATLAIYAIANLILCLPAHVAVARWSRHALEARRENGAGEVSVARHESIAAENLPLAMWLVTAGFAFSSLALSAVLSQMVPLLQALGFGASSLLVSTLFGPAQVAVRFSNLVFAGNRHPLVVGMFALSLLPAGLVIAALGAPSFTAAVAFVILVGLCSGLKSIVQGTVPLVLFGAKGFGSRLGLMAGFRYASGALAPFLFSFVSGLTSAAGASLVFAALGMLGVASLWQVHRLLEPREG